MSVVSVVAPCGISDPKRLADGFAIARAAGVELRAPEPLERPLRYLAADDDTRLAQLVAALRDPDTAAVWVSRGGYGLTRLLPRLPDDLPNKPIIGFSDVTALFAALWRRPGARLVHGPVLHSLPITDAPSKAHLWDVLAGRPTTPLTGETLAPGRAGGVLIGGNLAVLAALCGTPWQLDTTGAILVLEDVGEAPYRIDRLLVQIAQAGLLRGVAGVALGRFESCAPPAGATWTLRDVLVEALAPLGVPVVAELPIGHGAANHAFPWGARAEIGDGRLAWDAGDRPILDGVSVRS